MRVTVTRRGVAVVTARQGGVAVRAVGGGGAVSVAVRGVQGTSGDAAIAAHIADTTAAHMAGSIGLAAVTGMTSTDVQGAIEELGGRPAGVSADVVTAGLVDAMAFAADQG